ncbi:MAG: sirohydrochlorin chelatase [Alicyclobacillus sp.]|nr:sirohydrochlorin chelatase [Alicyclobacillus sp.]
MSNPQAPHPGPHTPHHDHRHALHEPSHHHHGHAHSSVRQEEHSQVPQGHHFHPTPPRASSYRIDQESLRDVLTAWSTFTPRPLPRAEHTVCLLVGHGSRDPEGNAQFLAFAQAVQQAAPTMPVEACFLEWSDPDIPAGIARSVARGARHILVLPVILLAASHVKTEIPALIEQARARYLQVKLSYGRNIGLHPGLRALLLHRFFQAARGWDDTPRQDWPGVSAAECTSPQAFDQAPDWMEPAEVRQGTGLVLMGRGSSDPEANSDLYKIGRWLWEYTGVHTVETCFSGITFPRLPQGVERAIALGAQRVLVLPYYIFTGVLMKRMQSTLEELQQRYPHVPMRMAEPFGVNDLLVRVVLDEISQVLAPEMTGAGGPTQPWHVHVQQTAVTAE